MSSKVRIVSSYVNRYRTGFPSAERSFPDILGEGVRKINDLGTIVTPSNIESLTIQKDSVVTYKITATVHNEYVAKVDYLLESDLGKAAAAVMNILGIPKEYSKEYLGQLEDTIEELKRIPRHALR